MPMKVSTFYPAIKRLLMGRTVSEAIMAESVRKGILELTENYKFQGLEVSGPTVNFTPYVSFYSPDYFLKPADAGLELEKVDSFYIFTQAFVTVTSSSQSNSGFNLKFRTVDDNEVLINIPGLPMFWSRYNKQIWIGSMPDQDYPVYMRYQKEHPFPLAGVAPPTTPNAGDDPVLLPNSWQDICEYASAMRCAQEINLSGKVTELHTRLYGDQKFQTSDGVEGSPGLIFQRTSQRNRDQTTSRKSFRLRMGIV